MSQPTWPKDFFIQKSMGNVLSGKRWHASAATLPKISTNDRGETVIQVNFAKATYLVHGGSSADFTQLGEGTGVEVGETNVVLIQSQMVMTGSRNLKVALLEYDESRRRVGEFYVSVNRLCRITLRPETRYLLPALRMYGQGEVTVKHLQIDLLAEESGMSGPMIEYFALPADEDALKLDPAKIEKALAGLENTVASIIDGRTLPEPITLTETDSAPGSYFSPTSIPAAPIISKPSAHVAGRIAADQDNKGDSNATIWQLLNPGKAKTSRKVVVISSREFAQRLSCCGEVTRAMPGREIELVDAENAYFVIDEMASRLGPWAGMLDAQGTAKFERLNEAVAAARSQGTVVVVIADTAPGHFTATLRGKADVVISAGIAGIKWDSDIDLPIIHEIEDIIKERKNNV